MVDLLGFLYQLVGASDCRGAFGDLDDSEKTWNSNIYEVTVSSGNLLFMGKNKREAHRKAESRGLKVITIKRV